jgi:hypothetical protein
MKHKTIYVKAYTWDGKVIYCKRVKCKYHCSTKDMVQCKGFSYEALNSPKHNYCPVKPPLPFSFQPATKEEIALHLL